MTVRSTAVRVAIVAALLSASACGEGSGTERVDSAAGTTPTTEASTTSSSTVADGGDAEALATDDAATTPTSAADETSTTRADTPEAESTTTSTSNPPPSTAEAAPARPIVPRSGTYTYRRTTTTSDGSETSTDDSRAERLSGDDSMGRVRLTQQSPEGQITSEATVSDAGTLVEHSVIESPLGEIDCDWDPDWLLTGPFAVGNTWSIDSACHDTSTGLEVDVEISGSGEIVGYEQVDVNGTPVTAWVLETTMVMDVTISSPTVNGTQRATSTSRTWIDPNLGMQVRDETHTESSGDFRNGASDVVSEFVRFSPA